MSAGPVERRQTCPSCFSCIAHGRPQPLDQTCTIQQKHDGQVYLLSVGPTLVHSPTQPGTFFQFLKSWRGEWMWTNIVHEGGNLAWAVDAMTNGTAI